MTTIQPAALAIDVVSDVVCPWCFIGKRRLEHALSQLAQEEPSRSPVVRWHPFELNPDLPRGGIDRSRYLASKFGEAQAAVVYQRIREAGTSVGIDFAFERITRQPNTRDAHRLIAWAQQQDEQAAAPLVERLFSAYFIEGRALTDIGELAAIATEAGLDGVAARKHLQSDAGSEDVAAAERHAHDLGISGVPFFIIAGRVGVSGAQSVEVLRNAIAQGRSATGTRA